MCHGIGVLCVQPGAGSRSTDGCSVLLGCQTLCSVQGGGGGGVLAGPGAEKQLILHLGDAKTPPVSGAVPQGWVNGQLYWQVGVFLTMLLKAAEARQVGPLLRSLQLQTRVGWKLGLHWFLHTGVSTSAQTLNPMPSHWPETSVPRLACSLEIGSPLSAWVASAAYSSPLSWRPKPSPHGWQPSPGPGSGYWVLGPIPASCEQTTVSPLPAFESPCREIVGHEMGMCVSPYGTGPVAVRTQQRGLAFPHIRPWSWPRATGIALGMGCILTWSPSRPLALPSSLSP